MSLIFLLQPNSDTFFSSRTLSNKEYFPFVFITYRSNLCKLFQMSYNESYMHVYLIHINKPPLGFSVQHFRIHKTRKVLQNSGGMEMQMIITKRMEYAIFLDLYLFLIHLKLYKVE